MEARPGDHKRLFNHIRGFFQAGRSGRGPPRYSLGPVRCRRRFKPLGGRYSAGFGTRRMAGFTRTETTELASANGEWGMTGRTKTATTMAVQGRTADPRWRHAR